MWLNIITVLNLKGPCPIRKMPCKLAPEIKHLRKTFSEKYYSVFVFAGSTLEANKGKSERKRKCYNIVLLTLGSMRTVLQVS